MNSLFFSSFFLREPEGINQMVVEGTPTGEASPSRVGSVAKLPSGAIVRIMDCTKAKPKLVTGFRTSSVDQALAMLQGHREMSGLELRTVY